MGKRVDKDPTMELSTSQLVPDRVRGDASVWAQSVVGTDQFAPAPPAKRDRRALWIALGFAVFTALAAGALYVLVV
jgi:hypothetical protein